MTADVPFAYLLSDNLEYADNTAMTNGGWTLTASPLAGYATAPAPLQGSYSFTNNASATALGDYTLSAAQTEFCFYTMWTANTLVNNPAILRLLDGTGTVILRVLVLAAGQIRVADGSGTAIQTSGAGVVTGGTTYHIWGRIVAGTGANAICDIYVSTTTTKGAATIAISTGAWTETLKTIRLIGVVTDTVIWDKIRIATSLIPDIPT